MSPAVRTGQAFGDGAHQPASQAQPAHGQARLAPIQIWSPRGARTQGAVREQGSRWRLWRRCTHARTPTNLMRLELTMPADGGRTTEFFRVVCRCRNLLPAPFLPQFVHANTRSVLTHSPPSRRSSSGAPSLLPPPHAPFFPPGARQSPCGTWTCPQLHFHKYWADACCEFT